MMTNVLLLIAGFFLLVRGADYLVKGAASIARHFGVRTFVVGLTVVAFGTSAPELVVNMFSAVSGAGDLAIGNVIGSNLANTLLILGTVAIVNPVKLTKGTVWKEIPFSLLAGILVLVMGADMFLDGVSPNRIARIDGLILLAFFVIFMYYTFGISKANAKHREDVEKIAIPKSVFFAVVGILGLGIGGKFIVDSATEIARTFGVSDHLIGATVVAIGTSLPELVTAVMAAMKKHSAMAVGNIIGSNIFNIFFVLASTAALVPLPYMTSAFQDVLILIAISVFLFSTLFIGQRRTVQRWQGYTFVCLYVGFVALSVFRG